MDIDPYAPCPGGTGKKIKFCCSDLTADLDKLSRMVSGEQCAAALELVDKLDEKYPDRACLLSTKAMLEAELGQPEKAAQTLARFRQHHPDNPVALAETAILEARDNPRAAVDLVQRAFEHVETQLPAQLYDALGVVGMALVGAGELLAARAHLMLQFGLSGGKDEQTLRMIVSLQGSPEIHLVAKENQPLVEPPADALWKSAFLEALENGRAGRWNKAAGQFQALADKAGAWPAIARNIAVLDSWLARRPAAVQAWRTFAAGDVPLDDAVEAQATALLLDDDSVTTVDVVRMIYPIRDIEALLAHLGASRQALRMPGDLRELVPENEPPPKGYFSLLDRARPESATGLTPDTIPWVLGQAAVYGRQTDREARLELMATRGDSGCLPAGARHDRGRHAGRRGGGGNQRPDQRGRRRVGPEMVLARRSARCRAARFACRRTSPAIARGMDRAGTKEPGRKDAAPGCRRSPAADRGVGRDLDPRTWSAIVPDVCRLQRTAPPAWLAGADANRSDARIGARAAVRAAGPAGAG